MSRNRLFIVALFAAAATTLAACGGSASTDSASTTVVELAESAQTAASPSTTIETETADAFTETTEPETPDTTQPPPEEEATCNWDSPRLASVDADGAPTDEGGEVSTTVLGSWQHTHTNTGAGFEPVGPTIDIRYVLSSDRFLYCQDVEGATDKQEISAPMNLEAVEIVLPAPATGYAVVAWRENTMVWLNHRDNSLYLLQRR
jgi:hypothetical protein